MDLTTFITQSLLALVLGSLVGLERQWHRRLVALKTNALVCMGAALFISVAAGPGEHRMETIRMAAQIVVGVGFIGGGLLFRDGGQVRGINTAATLWCCAAVGTLCGLGRLMEAGCASVLLVLANILLRDLARVLNLRMGMSDSLTEQVSFEMECDVTQAAMVRQTLETTLREQHADLRSVSETRGVNSGVLVTVVAAFENPDLQHEIDALLAAAEGWNVQRMSWRRL